MTNSKIMKNTLMLYTRQILIVFVNLYTVRVVLNVLGVEDYGVYYVVAGIVAFFSFLQGTMASATQRFFSFALGAKEENKLEQTFSMNLLVYIFIALLAFILLQTVGLWFVNEHLNIPPDRVEAAKWVYQVSIFTFIATIIATPFMAIIIAHEDMHYYAYISIVEVIIKLLIVLILPFIAFDKLIVYAVLMFISTSLITSIYFTLSFRKYKECQIKTFYWNRDLMREIFSFTSWTLFGQFSTVIRNHAITILLNQRFDPVTVAARVIAVNVASQVNMFAENFNLSMYPPIVKQYASKKYDEMFALIFSGSKATFFLMWIFFLPLFLEMDNILQLWLDIPPRNASLFTRLALIEVLITSISLPLVTAARAPGKMKRYELTLGIINILIFPFSWLLLEYGYGAFIVFVVAIIANMLMFVARLVILKSLIDLPILKYLKNVLTPIISVVILSLVLPVIVYSSFEQSLMMSLTVVFISILSASIVMYFIGLNKLEREKVKMYLSNYLNRRSFNK